MRKAPTVLLLGLAVPALSALPVISAPAAKAHPVAPEVHSAVLTGVDPAVLASAAGSHSRSVALRAWRTSATPTSRTTFGPTMFAASRPAVLVLAGARHTKTFSLLGVTWHAAKRPADLTVVVRAHAAKGWSAWTSLDAQAPPGGREASGTPGTEPLWVGKSDGYQVRIDLHSGALPRGLRVDLVAPGDSAADASAGQSRGPAAAASAAVAQPVINSRASWGADEKLRNGGPYYNSTIKEGFVHHTAGTNNYTAADVPKIIRGIYAYHVKGNGWSDIGYNFLVDRFGRLWEGRYGGITRAVQGAHTAGFNVDAFAVSAIGNYDKVAPTPVMIDAIARLMAWKLALYYRNPLGTTSLVSQGGASKYPPGRQVTFNVISGHRDAGNTECPGTYLYAQLANIRSLTASYLGVGLINPATSTDQVFAGTPLTVTAKTTQVQQWQLDVRNHLDGTLVRTLTGSAAPGDPLSATWDQLDANGAALRPGAYDLSLASWNDAGSARTWHDVVALRPPPTQPATAPAVPLPGSLGLRAAQPDADLRQPHRRTASARPRAAPGRAGARRRWRARQRSRLGGPDRDSQPPDVHNLTVGVAGRCAQAVILCADRAVGHHPLGPRGLRAGRQRARQPRELGRGHRGGGRRRRLLPESLTRAPERPRASGCTPCGRSGSTTPARPAWGSCARAPAAPSSCPRCPASPRPAWALPSSTSPLSRPRARAPCSCTAPGRASAMPSA